MPFVADLGVGKRQCCFDPFAPIPTPGAPCPDRGGMRAGLEGVSVSRLAPTAGVPHIARAQPAVIRFHDWASSPHPSPSSSRSGLGVLRIGASGGATCSTKTRCRVSV